MFKPRLRLRLWLLGLPAALPAFLTLFYLQAGKRRETVDNALAAHLRVARVAAAREAATFDGTNRLLATLAAFPGFRGNDRRACERVLSNVLSGHPGYTNLTIVNLDGSLFCAGRPVDAVKFGRPVNHRWFQTLRETGKPVISQPQVSATTGAAMLIVAAPLLDDSGKMVRMLSAGLYLEPLSELLGDNGLPPATSLTLINDRGIIIAHYPARRELIGRRFSNDSISIATDSESAPQATFHFVPVLAEPGLGGGYRVAMGMASSFDQAAANADQRQFAGLMLAAILLGALITLAMAQWWVVRPAQRLRGHAQRLAAGDLTARARTDGALLGLTELGDTFDAMAIAIESRQRERDEATTELGASERRYQMLFDQNPNAMWVYDAETLRFLEVNAVAIARYGYSRDEFMAMSITDIRPPEDAAACDAAAHDRPTSHRDNRRWRHRARDGRIIDVEIVSDAIDFGGRCAVLVAVNDITKRTRAEHALEEAEERMRFALEAADVGVWEANLTTGVGHWSKTCEVMHGLAPHSFGGTFESFVACIHPDDREEATRELARGSETRTDSTLEYRTAFPDQGSRTIRSIGRHFYDAAGRGVRVAGICMDITERRSIEGQLRQSQKMEAVGQLAGGIAHDFNNLLTIIGGNTDFARSQLPADSPAVLDLEQVSVAVDRASQLTRQLLAFGRKQILKTEPVDASEMIDRLMPMFNRLIEENITLRHVAQGVHPTTLGDAGQLEQAVINLVVNARDAMPGGGAIRITTGTRELTETDVTRKRLELLPGSYVSISVADTGVGMSPDVLAHAFEPFFTTKGVGKGTGLGLSSVYGTVKQSGGNVLAESLPGKGTTITLLLPRVLSVTSLGEREQAPRPALEGHGLTVLLVEDEAGVRALCERVLIGAGYQVLSADRADVAVSRAKLFEGEIDLILSDVVMPGPSIIDAFAAIRARRPAIKTILMSGYPDREVRDRMRTEDIDFIAKPFSGDALLSRVRHALASRRTYPKQPNQPRLAIV